MEIMVHPLATKHGPNFERAAIVAWLRQGSGECPLTRKPLTMSDLIHNNYLATEIATWRATLGIPTPLSHEAIDTQSRTVCHVLEDCSDVNNNLDAVDLGRLQHIYGTTTLPFDTVIPAAYGSATETSTHTVTRLSPTRSNTMPSTPTTSRSRPRLRALSPRKLWPSSLTPKRRLYQLRVASPAC
jgi:U-box domain